MTSWTRARQALLSSTASLSWIKVMLVALMTLSNHLVLRRPVLLLPSLFPNIRLFSMESSLLMRWPKDWNFSFRICPSSDYKTMSVQRCVCCCLVVKLCPTLRDPMDQSTPGPSVFHCLPKLGQIHVGGFHDTVQPSHPLSSPSSLAFPTKYWSLSFRICPSSEHSGLISCKMDRFVLLAVHT